MTASRQQSPRLLDGSFCFLAGLAVLSGGLAVWLKGPSALREAAGIVISDAVFILPLIGMGLAIGAFFSILVPRAVVSRYLGSQAGLSGLLIASFVGTIMPAGPFAAFPLIVALGRSGASIGALVAFLTAWSVVGLHRLFVWELPFMGSDFALLRFVTSLPAPILAGLIAERIVMRLPGFSMQWEKAE